MKNWVWLLTTIFIGSSCALVNKTAINSTSAIMQAGSPSVNQDGNFKFFSEATPGNLKIIEGFWFADQKNELLLSLLIKGYGGYAFGVNETMMLEEQLQGHFESEARSQAILNYSRAFDFGVEYLRLKGINLKDLTAKDAMVTIFKVLDKKLSRDDLEPVFYFAQSWGGLINLQRTNVDLVAQLGTVKSLMDWVCKREPEFENGSCHLFYAVYEASRPKMLGGDLEKGRVLFEKFIEAYPMHLLARTSFIQYYIIPTMDEALYAKYSEGLAKEFAIWEKSLNVGTRSVESEKYLKNKNFNLFNSIAKKRFVTIEKYKNEIF
jgi:hypothetical protein